MFNAHFVAVTGDCTTSHPPARLTGSAHSCCVQNTNGEATHVVLEHDTFFCPACSTVGVIICDGDRTWRWNGRRVAAHQDIAACACNPKPRINAITQRLARVEILIPGQETSKPSFTTYASTEHNNSAEYDERFLLLDGDGNPLTEIYYTAVFADGSIKHGETDAQGYTSRYATENAQEVKIYVGHLEKKS